MTWGLGVQDPGDSRGASAQGEWRAGRSRGRGRGRGGPLQAGRVPRRGELVVRAATADGHDPDGNALESMQLVEDSPQRRVSRGEPATTDEL